MSKKLYKTKLRLGLINSYVYKYPYSKPREAVACIQYDGHINIYDRDMPEEVEMSLLKYQKIVEIWSKWPSFLSIIISLISIIVVIIKVNI